VSYGIGSFAIKGFDILEPILDRLDMAWLLLFQIFNITNLSDFNSYISGTCLSRINKKNFPVNLALINQTKASKMPPS
jgi:hypothetical protein